MDTTTYLLKMRNDWDARARSNAHHFIADGKQQWSEEDFYASGRITVEGDILSDMGNICQGRDPKTMRVLELGCGAGRVTRALAEVFGSVDGVDVSPEMIQRARAALLDVPTARVHLIDGMSVQPVRGSKFDFAYSCCVFHHISSYEVIRGLVKDIGDTLGAGDLFKFEVQGCAAVKSGAGETWLGMPFSEQLAGQLAADCGFELRYHWGAGEERFWLWFFKK
jgi:SAM-dependent methyltransferase